MFETSEEAMEEKRVTDIICTKCRRMLRKEDPLVFPQDEALLFRCLATCPEHAMGMKRKIRLKSRRTAEFYHKDSKTGGWRKVQQLFS